MKMSKDLKLGTLYIVLNDIDDGFTMVVTKNSLLLFTGENSFLDILDGDKVFLYDQELTLLEEV